MSSLFKMVNQICSWLGSYCFSPCFRNLWSVSTCSCNREPTQTFKWFIAHILCDLHNFECLTNKVSWGRWLNYGKLYEYPFFLLVSWVAIPCNCFDLTLLFSPSVLTAIWMLKHFSSQLWTYVLMKIEERVKSGLKYENNVTNTCWKLVWMLFLPVLAYYQ